MPTISTNDLRPGMILGRDAVHTNGRVLLRGGVALEVKHIKMFKSWGLASVEIDAATREQAEPEAPDSLETEIPDAVRDELDSQFRHADVSHPMVGELRRLLGRRRSLQMNRDCDNEVDC